MPLSDDYQTEKEIRKEALELAKATTEFFEDMGVNDKRGFILFVCDLSSGVTQFMSDLDRVTSMQVVKMWIRENEPDNGQAKDPKENTPLE